MRHSIWRMPGTVFALGIAASFGVLANSEVRIATAPSCSVVSDTSGFAMPATVTPVPPPAERRIYAGRRNADKSFSTVEFYWDELSASQKSDLNTSPNTQKQDGLGEKRVAYLRGERAMEVDHKGGIFRKRLSALGDIAGNAAVFVGAPSSRIQGDGYDAYRSQNQGRPAAMFVRTDDGMLHAFSAENGREFFAYVPDALFPGLAALTSPAYVHKPYVDGGIGASEAIVRGQWRTVLAAAMGGGAQGVFALDVTRPGSFANGYEALFEFTDADDPDMGNLMAAPQIAKFRTKGKGGSADYKYFVVVPSGLDNYRDDGKGRYNKDAAGALFLLSLDKPASDPWKLGTNYFKFRTPSKESTLQNGLAAPAFAVDAAGAVRYAYAGDLQGNLWRFDFTGDLPWKTAFRSDAPLFIARGDKGARQPIAVQPRVVFAPGGYVVLFGTGKYLEEGDGEPGVSGTQTFYGIFDTGTPGYEVAGRSELAARTLSGIGKDVLGVTGASFEYGLGDREKKGWYVDLPDSAGTGERVVADPHLADGMVFFNTLIPKGGSCLQTGGRAYLLDALSGLAPGETAVGHVTSRNAAIPVLASVQTGSRDPIGRRTVRKTYSFVEPAAAAESSPANTVVEGRPAVVEKVLAAGRLGWREIINWQEMRNAIGKK